MPEQRTPRLSVIRCATCGPFGIDSVVFPSCLQGKQSEFYRLSAFAKQRQIDGRPSPVFAAVDQPTQDPQWVFVNCVHVLDAPALSVAERLDCALLNLARMSEKPGVWLPLGEQITHPVVYAEDDDVLHYLLVQLADAGVIETLPHDIGAYPPESIRLTVAGWNAVSDLQHARVGAHPERAFVAMWFDESLDDAYNNGIAPGIRVAGYLPRRMDRIDFVGETIDDRMLAEIRESRFVVADLTGRSPGAYFESGFAMGLDLPVIFTMREADLGDCHFDTNHYPVLCWNTPEQLRDLLTNRILAVIGRGPA